MFPERYELQQIPEITLPEDSGDGTAPFLLPTAPDV